MSRIINTLFLLLFSLAMQAQTAMEVLDGVADKFRKDGDVEIGFTLNPSSAPEAGLIKLAGEKFNLAVDGMVVWFDGTTMWTYVAENKEVNVTTPTATEVARMNPYAFVTMYKTGYKVAFGKSTSAYYDINLTTSDKGKNISRINLRVSKSNKQLQYVALHSESGVMEIKVNSYEAKRLPASTFTFDKTKYKDAEVIDLR